MGEIRKDPDYERLENLLIQKLGIDRDIIKADSKLGNDLGCDSLDYLELILDAEKIFGIIILDKEAEKAVTVHDAFNLIKSKIIIKG